MSSGKAFDRQRMIAKVIESPHNAHIGLVVVECRPSEALVRVPLHEGLVGNPMQRILHGGPITVLLDATFVVATYQAIDQPVPIATVDLRVDYLKPVNDGENLFAHCRCERVTRHVAFLRGKVYVDTPDRTVALATSTYMLDTHEGARSRR
jgi:uncharacterized protein (TIGR00369 family)